MIILSSSTFYHQMLKLSHSGSLSLSHSFSLVLIHTQRLLIAGYIVSLRMKKKKLHLLIKKKILLSCFSVNQAAVIKSQEWGRKTRLLPEEQKKKNLIGITEKKIKLISRRISCFYTQNEATVLRNLEIMLLKHLLVYGDIRKPRVSQGVKTLISWSLVGSKNPAVITKFYSYHIKHGL